MGASKSLQEVQEFYELYGPEIWGVLFEWNAEWEHDVEYVLRSLRRSTPLLAEIMNNPKGALSSHPDISKILLLQPGEYRHKNRVGVLTKHIWGLLKNEVEIQGGRLPHHDAEWNYRN